MTAECPHFPHTNCVSLLGCTTKRAFGNGWSTRVFFRCTFVRKARPLHVHGTSRVFWRRDVTLTAVQLHSPGWHPRAQGPLHDPSFSIPPPVHDSIHIPLIDCILPDIDRHLAPRNHAFEHSPIRPATTTWRALDSRGPRRSTSIANARSGENRVFGDAAVPLNDGLPFSEVPSSSGKAR